MIQGNRIYRRPMASPVRLLPAHPTYNPSVSTPVSPTNHNHTNSTDIGKIIGGALGGIIFLLLVVVLLLLRRQHITRKRNRGVQPGSIHAFRVWEHRSSSVNDSETTDSTNDTDAQEDSIAISNRNTEIPVPGQYRSQSDIFKKMKKGPRKIQSNVQSSEVGSEVANTMWNTTPAAGYQDIPISLPRPTRRTPNILRHLDSGIRVFQEVNTGRENQNGDSESVVEKEHGSESADTAEEVIELPPEYSCT
ncbi:hypothetical protein VKT23_007747 [Stygiomarasmius scandens]|uniref:Uncharacterized protein n=1 Tax=Marasmiellus scandens TaxID=2682957 RepID=A0ABR1JKT5_9AGAR